MKQENINMVKSIDLTIYTFTKPSIIKKVVSYYLQGFSDEEIYIKCNQNVDFKMIDNVIICYNYLNN